MKKNLFAMIVVILSGVAANASCYGLRNGEQVCMPQPKFEKVLAKGSVHCAGNGSTLDFEFQEQPNEATVAMYSYLKTISGHCPSRNCGSTETQEVSGSSDQGGFTAMYSIDFRPGADVNSLALTSSLDSSKNFAVSYVVQENQVQLLSLSIGGQAFSKYAMAQLTCAVK